jgi:hypothetical protein
MFWWCGFYHPGEPIVEKDYASEVNRCYSEDCVELFPDIKDSKDAYNGKSHLDTCIKCQLAEGHIGRRNLIIFNKYLLNKYYKPNTDITTNSMLKLLNRDNQHIIDKIDEVFNRGNFIRLSQKTLGHSYTWDGVSGQNVWINYTGAPSLTYTPEVILEDYILGLVPDCEKGDECVPEKVESEVDERHYIRCGKYHSHEQLINIFKKCKPADDPMISSVFYENLEYYYHTIIRKLYSPSDSMQILKLYNYYKTYIECGSLTELLSAKINSIYEAELIDMTTEQARPIRKSIDDWIISIFGQVQYIGGKEIPNDGTQLFRTTKFDFDKVMEIVHASNNSEVTYLLESIFINLKDYDFRLMCDGKFENVLNFTYAMEVFETDFNSIRLAYNEIGRVVNSSKLVPISNVLVHFVNKSGENSNLDAVIGRFVSYMLTGMLP